MAYSLTTASNLDDVCAQIKAFAIANAGFADAGSATVSGKTLYRLSKGGIVWHFIQYTSGNNIGCYMAYSNQSSLNAVSSAGQDLNTYMSAFAFPGPYPNLYLYTEGTCVHAVLELTTGIFNHISFGDITKTETFTGGQYLTAGYYPGTFGSPAQYYDVTSPYQNPTFVGNFHGYNGTHGQSFVRAVPASGALNDYRDFARAGVAANSQKAGFSGPDGMLTNLLRDSPNNATLRTPLFPMYVSLLEPVSGLLRMSGYIPGVRVIPNEMVDPASIILTDWQCFPHTQKNASTLIVAPCGNYGLAYKRA